MRTVLHENHMKVHLAEKSYTHLAINIPHEKQSGIC
jgi:hypothetical protein